MMKYETDSRKVKDGQIFVAIKGHTVDGHDYINDAIKNGASKIICEHDIDSDVEYLVVDNTEEYLKNKISEEYKDKIKNLKIIGVTGTSGKTTSCYLIYQMLLKLGKNASYLGTLGYYNNNIFVEENNTTPDILNLYKILLKAVEDNVEYLVMEVSSHSLAFERLKGVELSIGAFTNLSQDHLDYHKTMEAYLNEKLKIMNYLKHDAYMIVNSDDENSSKFKNYKHVKTFGENGDYKILEYNILPDHTDLKFSYDNKEYNTTINLTGKFNIYNYLTCISILNTLGFSLDDLVLNTKYLYPPKGRCETIKVKDGFAIIDYAHKPDAVLKILNNYNEFKKNRIITIIGCGGDRDPKKRPIMGNIATSNSDIVIFTSDNPRTEDPKKILEDITRDNKSDNYMVIENRKDAINKGLEILEKDDILLILGKGHEDYQIIGHVKHHFDDAEIVRDYIKSIS